MKVLISFAGSGDPVSLGEQKEDATLTLARQENPEHILLYCSKKRRDNGEKTKALLSKEVSNTGRQMDCDVLLLSDSTYYETIMREIDYHWREFRQGKRKEKLVCMINLSSGTPQERTALLLLTHTGVFPQIRMMQVLDSWGSEKQEVREVHINVFRERTIIRKMALFLQSLDFNGACAEAGDLEDSTVHSMRREKASFYEEVFKGYLYWDLMKYHQAFTLLETMYRRYQCIPEFSLEMKWLQEQLSILEPLRAETSVETEDNLLDLYYNALRRFKKGQYTDTLARFWRLVEGYYYYLLRKAYGIEPNDVEASLNARNRDRVYEELHTRNHVNYWQAQRLLTETFAHGPFLDLMEKEVCIPQGTGPRTATETKKKVHTELRTLRVWRNESIVAHGMRPVKWEEAQSALIIGAAILDELIPQWREKEYPLSPTYLAGIAQGIKSM